MPFQLSHVAAIGVCAFVLAAQGQPAAEQKHLSVPTQNNLQPWSASADEVERDLPYPAVLHLKGRVEIKMPVCVVTGPGTAHTCGGYTILKADEVDIHEASGQIEARGSVTMTSRK